MSDHKQKNDVQKDKYLDDLTIDFMSGDPDYDGTTSVSLWADPVIFNEKAKALFLKLPQTERLNYAMDLIDEFYISRPEFSKFARRTIYENPLALLDLFKSLTFEEFETLNIGDAEARFKQLQEAIKEAEAAIEETPIDRAKGYTMWPILSIRGMFLISEFAAFYYLKNPAPERETATIKRADKIEYPLDKPNHFIWNLLESDTHGQITFDMLPKSPELKAYITYSINFNDLEITKRLTPFDKRVYIAVSALYNAGNEVFTLSQIYYAMGNTGRPGQRDLTKINDAITKMRRAEISLNSSDEADKIKNYTKFVYDGVLLPMERVTAIMNGKLTDGAIKLFREPPLMTFAKNRKQVTTIDIKLLQSPISKTDANLLIDDYLLERIHKEKRAKKGSCTILLDTLYKYANLSTSKQKQRAPEKIEKYLKYYKEAGLFKSYKLSKDKIVIVF